MTTALAIRSFLELAAILLALYGVAKEDKLIAFEQKVWRILFVNYRRYKRKKYGMPLAKKRHKAKMALCKPSAHAFQSTGKSGFVA